MSRCHRFLSSGAGRRQAIAVRAGDEILGSIWVAEGTRPLAHDSPSILQDAARIVSEHLVSRHAQAQPDRQFAEELTRQIISGEADVIAAASWLQVDPGRPCRVLALALPEEYHGEARRLADLLLMYFSAYRLRVLTVLSRGRVYVIACSTATGSVDIDVARDMVARAADALRLEVRAVAGPAVPTLDQAGASREHADRALRVLSASPSRGAARLTTPPTCCPPCR